MWRILALTARPEKSYVVGKVGVWRRIAAKRHFLDLDLSLFQKMLN